MSENKIFEKWNAFIDSLRHSLFRFIRIEPLIVFRMVFGCMMIVSVVRFMALGWIEKHYIQPKVFFHYYGFSWVEPLGSMGMYAVHVIMLLAAVGIALGFFYRLSALLFFLTFTYCQLIDLTYYLNHYYFVSIVSAMLIFLPANRYFSLDVYFNRVTACTHVPAWTKHSIMLQMAIVYVFAGIFKINEDWLLHALPLKIWLPANTHLPIIGSFMGYDITAYIFSWMGMLYDISIPLLLLYRKTRPWAYLSVVFFHSITGILFQIGIFPIVMMSGTLVFFHDAFHQTIIAWFSRLFRSVGFYTKDQQVFAQYNLSAGVKSIVTLVLFMHFSFQLLFPWRYLLYPGNVFWTEEGYRFSWRVMLIEKAGTATFYVKDAVTGREGVVFNNEFLNLHQEKQMAMQPDMILQFAHYLADYYRQRGINDPMVRAEVYVTLNARPSRLLIDPTLDLVKVEEGWKHKEWITSGEIENETK
jgi:hypothetical protein